MAESAKKTSGSSIRAAVPELFVNSPVGELESCTTLAIGG